MAALIAAGIELTDFSMGSPSLDEVFFALTGGPADAGTAEPTDDRGRPRHPDRGAAPRAAVGFSNAIVFGWRAVLKFRHVPEQLFDLVMTPIMFTLLFTFVFGGALAGSTGEYLQFFLPGILVQTVAFNAVYSGMGLSTDLGKGLFDRFRSLPIWPLAPFAGLMVGDVLRHLIAGGDHPRDRPDPRLPARGGGAGRGGRRSRCWWRSGSGWAGSSSCSAC